MVISAGPCPPFRLNLLVVSKYLCCEMQVVIFRIVLHTDIEYGHMIYRILNYDLQTISSTTTFVLEILRCNHESVCVYCIN